MASSSNLRRLKLLAACSAAALLAGCITLENEKPVTKAPAAPSISVNKAYKTGAVANIEAPDVPGLAELMEAIPEEDIDEEAMEDEDRLRIPAMRDAAFAYGARGGLAHAMQEINRQLMDRSRELSDTYDFERLVIQGPNGAKLLPPVISEALDTWESSDGGKSLRVADQYFEIINDGRFVPTAPLWHGYLLRSYDKPSPPPDSLFPQSSAERKVWARYVEQGWKMGHQQAREIFEHDLRRLERDFTGMVRYKRLLSEGKVSAPIVASAELGVTGDDDAMRVNDKAMRITRDAKLKSRADGTDWKPAPSSMSAPAAAMPPLPRPEAVKKEKALPRVSSPKGKAEEVKAVPSTPVSRVQMPDPVSESTGKPNVRFF